MDEWADAKIPVDGTKGCLNATVQLKQRKPELKVILSVGGGSGSKQFPEVAACVEKRHRFAVTCKLLVEEFGLDGVDSMCINITILSLLPLRSPPMIASCIYIDGRYRFILKEIYTKLTFCSNSRLGASGNSAARKALYSTFEGPPCRFSIQLVSAHNSTSNWRLLPFKYKSGSCF
jgi:hypothetical protein